MCPFVKCGFLCVGVVLDIHRDTYTTKQTQGYAKMSVAISSCSRYTKVNVAVTFSPPLIFLGGVCVMNCVNLF